MKLAHLFFLLALLSLTACGDDDSGSGDPYILSYENGPDNAPALGPGTHVLLARFPSDYLQNNIGKKLNEIELYVDLGAVAYNALVLGPNSATAPGTELARIDFTNRVNDRKWYIIDLNDPIEITGEDIWIGVEVVHNQSAQTVGCDAGPRNPNGDWIWSSDSNVWQTFNARSGGEQVNWNIIGNLID